jgi:hypothetical protein
MKNANPILATAAAFMAFVALAGCDSNLSEVLGSTFSSENIATLLTSILEAVLSGLIGS